MRIDAARQQMEAGSARRIQSSLFMAVRTVDSIGHGIDVGLASISAKFVDRSLGRLSINLLPAAIKDSVCLSCHSIIKNLLDVVTEAAAVVFSRELEASH